MQIKLQNIGIIRDSTIALDGLTVITGKNNSGKSTVGKTLYALLEGVSFLRTRAQSDQTSYIRKRLDSIENILSEGLFYGEVEPDHWFTNQPALRRIIFEPINWDEWQRDDLEQFAHSLEQELKELSPSSLESLHFNHRVMRVDSETGQLVTEEVSMKDAFMDRLTDVRDILEQMFVDLQKDPDLIDYARESVNQTLRVEFSSQIQPVKAPGVISEVNLSDNDGSPYLHFSVVNNSIVNDGNRIFFSSPCKRVFMIDDPFILDTAPGRTVYRSASQETLLNMARIQPHNYKLRQTLRSSSSVSVFEQTLLNDSLQFVKEQIDRVLPGTFEFSPVGDYYVQDGAKIKTVNLATGSKMFSILKILLEKGRLDKDTMLILDEPEAHLHPKWQNAFAEVIVLLVKRLDVNILLTTHSPNFMLALDAYMRKYELNQKTNFYQTVPKEDGFVSYRCVNDDLGAIYDDFLQYLSQVKLLRDQYLYGKEGAQ